MRLVDRGLACNLKLTKLQSQEIDKHLAESKELYNTGVDYFDKNNKFNVKDVYANFYTKHLYSSVKQQILIKLDKNYKSYFNSPNYDKGLPNKLVDYSFLVFNNQYLEYNCSIYKKTYHDKFLNKNNNYLKVGNTYIKLPCIDYVKIGLLREIIISKKRNRYRITFSYKREIINLPSKSNKLGIDLGIRNFIACSTNTGIAWKESGSEIIDINKKYFERQEFLYSKLKVNKITKKIIKNVEKRDNRINDYFNKLVLKIISFCIENNVNEIIIGKNKNWKKGSLNKEVNKEFRNIPYLKFLKKLESKAEDFNITITLTEESYTSKSSFFDRDNLPSYREEDNVKYKFSGVRYNEIYITGKGLKIDSDIHGSLNIIRKIYKRFYLEFNKLKVIDYNYKPVGISIIQKEKYLVLRVGNLLVINNKFIIYENKLIADKREFNKLLGKYKDRILRSYQALLYLKNV